MNTKNAVTKTLRVFNVKKALEVYVVVKTNSWKKRQKSLANCKKRKSLP